MVREYYFGDYLKVDKTIIDYWDANLMNKQGAKVGTLGRQIKRNSSYVRFAQAHTSIVYIWFEFYVSLPNEIKLLHFDLFFFGKKQNLIDTTPVG